MNSSALFDITFVGHYTKDTIVYPTNTKQVNGGAYYYGAHVEARMGKRVAVVTRMAQEDLGALDDLKDLGVAVFPYTTPHSSLLRLVYPTTDWDRRTLELTSSAGPFTLDQVQNIQSRVFAIVASSVRGEVPVEVVEELARRDAMIALDVQGFVRILRDGKLDYDNWPGKEAVLRHVNVLKTDAVEAELLTGESDRAAAARRLSQYGPREVLLTHSGGVMICHDGVIDEVPLVPKQINGRSGRGDTCTSSYLCRRLTAPAEEAVVWAAAVTSLKLETEGPFRRELSEVEALAQELQSRRRRLP